VSDNLTGPELQALFERVFRPRSGERSLAVLVDLPDLDVPDNPAWFQRRDMACEWVERLLGDPDGLRPRLVAFQNARRNNADLPEVAWVLKGASLPDSADDLDPAQAQPFDRILQAHAMVVAPTEFSATAPLKLAASRLGFRGATMPGFRPSMIPALRLDYGEINRRVKVLADLLDRAVEAEVEFLVDGERSHHLRLDLRHRTAHKSGGLFPEPGQVGNLPSGEAYIVPYEGEIDGDPTRTEGAMPVQFGDEIVVYRIAGNRAFAVDGDGTMAAREHDLLVAEPAYGNLAELGLGVLGDFGVQPVGEILLDEKLGLHIAFGRSDHFGGQVGARDFSRPEAVVHIDRVYVPAMQPRITLPRVDLALDDGAVVPLMRDGRYAIRFEP
jgi:leucyl aminopeptidase (aminopeptidase T)